MHKILTFFLAVLLTARVLGAQESPFKFEGIIGSRCESIENMNSMAIFFIPYNPVIVEIGAYSGKGTATLARIYPYGTIYAFEPQPEAYSQLVENMKSLTNVTPVKLALNTFNGFAKLNGSGTGASLLYDRTNRSMSQKVPCMTLDDWCYSNGIDHIDFLRIDAGGFEWQICKSSPRILKTVSVIVIKTHVGRVEKPIVKSSKLKELLKKQGFTLLSHWYKVGKTGEAVFVRKCMYDSIFN